MYEYIDGNYYGGYSFNAFNPTNTSSTHTGKLTITKLDTVNHIVSGTFWFDILDYQGNLHQIREGRFDYAIHKLVTFKHNYIMNKLLFLGKGLLLLLFYKQLVTAQTVSTDYATQINSTFSNLDKTRIPHKLLVDYAMEFEELSNFNGVLTSNNITNKGTYTGIYNTLLMARVNANVTGLVNPTIFKNNWDNLRQTNKIVLSGLYYKYNEFKPNAPK